MKPKRIYFFKDDKYLLFAARSGSVDNNAYPTAIAPKWAGLTAAGFDTAIDAALNGGNGFVYFFKGPDYVRYDPRHDKVDGPSASISSAWHDLDLYGFDSDLDAALYYKNGKVLFFKGDSYLRYDISADAIDAGYPKKISQGWSNLPAFFSSWIDAAVNVGDGKAYLFKADQCVRIDIATNAVDAGYPIDIVIEWPALVPADFTDGLGAIVEWPYAEVAGFDVRVEPCTESTVDPTVLFPVKRVMRLVAMVARFSTLEHPADCRAGEYRQFVRGVFEIDGQPKDVPMANPSGGPPLSVLPRPLPGAVDDNYREDSIVRATSTARIHYGHRDELPGITDPTDRYVPDRATGCDYLGFDFPFLDGLPNQSYLLDLDFRGLLIDVCNGNEELARKEWPVNCRGTFSSP
jgi:hypothetical protein